MRSREGIPLPLLALGLLFPLLLLGFGAGMIRGASPAHARTLYAVHLDGVALRPGSAQILPGGPGSAPVPTRTYQVDCQVRLENRSGATQQVMTTLSGVYDGLTLVVADLRGRRLVEASYASHQSPYSSTPRPIPLAAGTTRGSLVFPIGGDVSPLGQVIHLSLPRRVRVWLEGELLGVPGGRGLRSNVQTVTVP